MKEHVNLKVAGHCVSRPDDERSRDQVHEKAWLPWVFLGWLIGGQSAPGGFRVGFWPREAEVGGANWAEIELWTITANVLISRWSEQVPREEQ